MLSTAIRAESLSLSPRIQAAWMKWARIYVDQNWRDRESDRLFRVRTVLKKQWERNPALAPDRILGTIGGWVFALKRSKWLQENRFKIEQMNRHWRGVKKNFLAVKDGPSASISIPKEFDWAVDYERDQLKLHTRYAPSAGAAARRSVSFLVKTFVDVTGSQCYREAALLSAVAFPEWKSAKSRSVKGLEDAAKKILRAQAI